MKPGSGDDKDPGLDKRPAFGTRTYLLALVLALVIPSLLFTGYVLMRYAGAERSRIEQQATDQARNLAAAVDLRVSGLIEALRVLAGSGNLDEQDFSQFHRRALQMRDIIGRHIVLRDISGQQIVNSRMQWGEPLPRFLLPDDAGAIRDREIVVSDVFKSPISEESRVSIITPILRDEKTRYLLSMAMELNDMRLLLDEGRLPEGHIGAILDTKGVFIARTKDQDTYAGKPAQFVPARSTGVTNRIDIDGQPVLTAWTTSSITGWIVTSSVPRNHVDTPLMEALVVLAGMGIVTLMASTALAWGVGGRISGSLRSLATAGEELGARKRIHPVHTPVSEVNEIGLALWEAGERLNEYEERLEKALWAAGMFSFEWVRYDDAIIRSASAASLMGVNADAPEMRSRSAFRASVHPQDRDHFSRASSDVTQQHPDYRIEYRYIRPSGETVWFETSGYAEFDKAGKPLRITGFTTDVTARKQSEMRQALLVRELHHRVKNNLATVLAVANLSGRNASSLEDYKRKLRDRIQSMARSHTLLTENAFQKAQISGILTNELEAYADSTGERIMLDGPEIDLSAEVAVSLGMAFHELATNAGKYGSLSVDGGKLSVAWTTSTGEQGRRVHIHWRESGGPPVTRPLRRGFGSRLLDNVIGGQLRGRVQLQFEPDGLIAEIEAALDQPDYAARSAPP